MDSSGSNENEFLEFVGYQRCWPKTLVIWAVIVLSGFTLLLLFYWRRDYLVILTHSKVNASRAEIFLVRSPSMSTEICNVNIQSLSTNQRIYPYKSAEARCGTETNSLRRKDDDENCTIKFFLYRNLKYVWCKENGKFIPVTGLDEIATLETLPTKPLLKERVDYLLAYYGLNQINVPLTPIPVKLFREVLSPFYVFQIFSIILWMTSEYYFYASVIFLFSIISVALSTYTCRKNELQLLEKVKVVEFVFVLRGHASKPIEILSTNLVPGDIVCIPSHGCELFADMLLISGSCIVDEASLTGESTAQTKLAISEFSGNSTEEDKKIDMRKLSHHVLFNGTRVLRARESQDTPLVKAVVLRTGFLTAKGNLIRTILYPKRLDIDFTLDGYRFLSIMAIIAILGSIYTWIVLYRYNFSLGMLVRKSLDILTVVIPPALPTVMTTSLYLAQLRLKKQNVFCINPSAIPIAGGLNTFVFDKTGTLTEEYMSVKGVWRSGVFDNSLQLCEMHEITNTPSPLSAVLAACHCLTYDSPTDEVIGDPLDKVIFTATKWRFREPNLDDLVSTFANPIEAIIYKPNSGDTSPWQQLSVLRHFPFSSTILRQSVVVETAGGDSEIAVLTKGAPEAVASLCDAHSMPMDWEKALNYFTEEGYRVLALAWKPITQKILDGAENGCDSWRKVIHLQRRDYFERDLLFLGLVVLDNPVKPATKSTLDELLKANIRVVMATGDNLLTAVSVARQCNLIGASEVVIRVTPSNGLIESSSCPSPLLCFEVLSTQGDSSAVENAAGICETLSKLVRHPSVRTDDTVVVTVAPGEVLEILSKNFHLAMSGTTWNFICTNLPNFVPTVLTYGTLFARFSPADKTTLVRALQAGGLDGYGGNSTSRRQVGMCGDGLNDCGALKAAHVGIALSDCETSISAPFTSRSQNILSVTHILREGRCSLSTAIGAFKFMVLYSFVQFFTVLILYHIANTLTDAEYLIIDFFFVAPLSVSYALTRPWKKLEPRTVPLRLITCSNLVSIFVHLFIAVVSQVVVCISVQHQPWWKPFKPSENRLDSAGSFEGTSLFYFTCFQYVFVCIVVAKGPPFRAHIYSNKFFLLSIISLVAFTVGLILFPVELLVNWAQLLPLHGPDDTGIRKYTFSIGLIIAALLYFITTITVEKIIDMIGQKSTRLSPTCPTNRHLPICDIERR